MTRIIKATSKLLLVAVCLVTAAQAQSVKVNWRKNAAFSDYKTYAWQFSPKEKNSFYKQFVTQDVNQELSKKGLQKVAPDQHPDLLIAYHFTTQELMNSTTTTDGFGWDGGPWGYWGGWGGWGDIGPDVATTEVNPVNMGILTIDLADAKNHKLVWRGQATEDSVASSQKGDEKQMKKSVDKMFDKYPPKK